MAEKESWPHATVVPRRGIAFFDGIFVRGDSIYNPRPDRILPIFEEEQVLVCRLMGRQLELKKEQLKRDIRVLDVGTGSGIFAIYAAKAGCQVVAIDNNPRACRFARSNADFNGIDVLDDARKVASGKIAVIEDEFNENFDLGKFDAVILSPSYTPTSPEFQDMVAVHASSGSDGLEQFRKQIKIVPHVLNDGGLCFGNQMSVVKRSIDLKESTLEELITDPKTQYQLEIIGIIERAFSGKFTLECVPILSQLKRTDEFLEGEFKGSMEQLTAEQQQRMIRWQKKVFDEFPYLAFLYYQIIKGGHHEVTLGEIPWSDLPWKNSSKNFPPDRRIEGWEHRVRIHRAVVEHKLNKGFDPLPVFITNGTTDSLLSYESARTIDSSRFEESRILRKNPLALIDKEIQSHRLGELFSIIYLDTTPIHPKEGGFYDFKLERRVWINGEAREDPNNNRIKELALNILGIWQEVTVGLQSSKCGVGFHPAFTGLVGQWKAWRWPEIVYSEFPSKLDELQSAAKSIVAKRFEAMVEGGELKAENLQIEESLFYSRSPLTDLQAASFEDNIQAFQERASALREQVTRHSPEALNYLDSKDISQLDLYACQLNMHEQVQKRFKSVVNNEYSINTEESMLFSVPLGMIYYEEDDSHREFPPYFKGGLWAWFVPRGRRRLRHEEAAQQLLQVMWVLLTASYSALSEQSRERTARLGVTESFAHEVKRVAGALTNILIHPAGNFFALEPSSKTSTAFGGKLGRIEIASDIEALSGDLGITFFQKNVTGAGALINLWCQSANPSDAKGVIGEGITDIHELAQACWRASIDALPVYALAKEVVIGLTHAKEDLERAKGIEEAIKSIFVKPIVTTENQGKFPKLDWRSDRTGWLARLLLALLNNCIMHGDPNHVPEIKFICESAPRFQIQVTNRVRPSTDAAILQGLTASEAFSQQDAVFAMGWLSFGSAYFKDTQQGRFKSKEVIANCAAQLDGRITYWTENPQPTAKGVSPSFTVNVDIIYEGNENERPDKSGIG